MPGETTESGATAEQPSATGFEDAFEAFAKGETPPAEAADEATEAEPKKDPEPQPDSSEPGENTGAAAPAPDQTASDDIDWDSLPAPARKALERAQHEAKSLKGRLSAADRQLHEYRSTRAADPAPKAADEGKPAKQFDPEQLKALREDYPELAGPLLDVIEGLQTKLDSMSGAVTAVEADRTNEFLDRQEATLVELMPDWKTWGSDKRFENWIVTQPRHIQEAAARNAQVIADASEAFDVLERFKTAHAAPALATDPKRERQLNAGRDATTKAPVAGSGPPDDFEGAFGHFAAKQAAGKR